MYKIKTLLVGAITVLIYGSSYGQLQKATPSSNEQKTSAEVGQRKGAEPKYILHVESGNQSKTFEEVVGDYTLDQVNSMLNAYNSKYATMTARKEERNKEESQKIQDWFTEMDRKIAVLNKRKAELTK